MNCLECGEPVEGKIPICDDCWERDSQTPPWDDPREMEALHRAYLLGRELMARCIDEAQAAPLLAHRMGG